MAATKPAICQCFLRIKTSNRKGKQNCTKTTASRLKIQSAKTPLRLPPCHPHPQALWWANIGGREGDLAPESEGIVLIPSMEHP